MYINPVEYSSMSDVDYLVNLPYVRLTNNNRVVYEVRFPNAPIDYEDSVILVLNPDSTLKMYDKRSYSEDGKQVVRRLSERGELLGHFPYMGSYDQFVTSCFLCCARKVS